MRNTVSLISKPMELTLECCWFKLQKSVLRLNRYIRFFKLHYSIIIKYKSRHIYVKLNDCFPKIWYLQLIDVNIWTTITRFKKTSEVADLVFDIWFLVQHAVIDMIIFMCLLVEKVSVACVMFISFTLFWDFICRYYDVAEPGSKLGNKINSNRCDLLSSIRQMVEPTGWITVHFALLLALEYNFSYTLVRWRYILNDSLSILLFGGVSNFFCFRIKY